MNLQDKIYSFKDIPLKRRHIFDRTKKIYPNISDEKINNVLDSLKIVLRDQREKGASNHERRMIYIGLRELKKYNLETEAQFKAYLESPYSPIVHETTHIFQNLNDEFPHIIYNEKKNNGDYEINYKKYVTDPGELQARIEHVIELLKWGFTKGEIIAFLHSRKYEDFEIWKGIVNKAEKLFNSID